MFTKRKYAKKRQTKRVVRRHVSRKRQILRPQNESSAIEKPTFDASGASAYLWMQIAPGVRGKDQENEKNEKFAVPSLRKICADVVAANPETIHSSYFASSSWPCWRLVWESALEQGTDLPSLFKIFMNAFGLEKSFNCHPEIYGTIERIHSSVSQLKQSALMACAIPTNRKHRIENVFSNISLPDFVSFVGSVENCAVVIDCCKMPLYSTSTLISLCKISTIEAIDLSYNPVVDDQFLNTLNCCLVSGNSNLKILRVCGCAGVSSRGILTLLEAKESSLLSYIETDVCLKPESMFLSRFQHAAESHDDAPIPGTKWRLINEEHSTMAIVGKQSLATKLFVLLRLKKILLPVNGIWDIKFFKQEANQAMDVKMFNEITWLLRLQNSTRRNISSPFMYIKEPGSNVAPKFVADMSEKKEAHSFSKLRKKKSQSQSSRKPKFVHTNANSFFYGA